jgi:hypothetical protein
MSLVVGSLVAADNACADVVRIGIDDFVLYHTDPPESLGGMD